MQTQRTYYWHASPERDHSKLSGILFHRILHNSSRKLTRFNKSCTRAEICELKVSTMDIAIYFFYKYLQKKTSRTVINIHIEFRN